MYNGAKILVKKVAPVKQIKVLPFNRVIEARMALKLDDLIGKKKEVAQVLDLAKATANSHEEFKKIMEKVPEFRIKAEKIKPDDVRTFERERRSSRRRSRSKKTRDKQTSGYQFADPVPEEMREVKLGDLCPVNIQWNMLTTLRPKTKMDTEYFSRLVELGKLQLATQEKEKKITDESFKRKMKNKAGVVETRYLSCNECGEDFCQKEACMMFTYENFRREPMQEVMVKKEEKRGRTLSKTKKKKNRSKSSRRRKGVSAGRAVGRENVRQRSLSRSTPKRGGKSPTKNNEKTVEKSSPSKRRSSSKAKIKENKPV